MKSSDPVPLRAAAKAISPIAALLAAAVLTGGGAGLAAGALLATTLIVHALVFGAGASMRAFAPLAWRAAAGVALMALIAAACAPDWIYAATAAEIAGALAFAAASGLAFQVLAARVPALRDEEW